MKIQLAMLSVIILLQLLTLIVLFVDRVYQSKVFSLFKLLEDKIAKTDSWCAANTEDIADILMAFKKLFKKRKRNER